MEDFTFYGGVEGLGEGGCGLRLPHKAKVEHFEEILSEHFLGGGGIPRPTGKTAYKLITSKSINQFPMGIV